MSGQKKIDGLADLIDKARASTPMSEAEWQNQRASFVRGQLAMGSDADEARYRAEYKAFVDNIRYGKTEQPK